MFSSSPVSVSQSSVMGKHSPAVCHSDACPGNTEKWRRLFLKGFSIGERVETASGCSKIDIRLDWQRHHEFVCLEKKCVQSWFFSLTFTFPYVHKENNYNSGCPNLKAVFMKIISLQRPRVAPGPKLDEI